MLARQLQSILISLKCFALGTLANLAVVSFAHAEIPFFFDELNQLSDNTAAYLINAPGSDGDDVTLDEGDRIRGILRIETIEDQTGGGGTVSLLDPTQATEFTAIFDVTVAAKTAVPDQAGIFDYQFRPTVPAQAWSTLPGPAPAPGTMVRFYEDPQKNFTRLLPAGMEDDGDPDLTGADIGSGPFASEEVVAERSTDGTSYWDFGFTGPTGDTGQPTAAPGEGWSARAAEDITIIRATPLATGAGVINLALSLTDNFEGPALGQVASGFGGTAQVNGSAQLLGIQDANTPYDFFANADLIMGPSGQSAIGDFVWEDQDGDGLQDDGEPGVDGVSVELYGCGPDGMPGTADDVFVAATTTDINGEYLFEGLEPGQYTVQFQAPEGFEFTARDQGVDDNLDSDANPADGHTACIDLAAGETDRTWDAGLVQPAAVGDFVWNDSNRDGIQDDGEAGVEGVTVELLAGCTGDTVIASTTTNTNGLYEFTDLAPGNYRVRFALPDDFQFSPQNVPGGTAATDSDANPNTGETDCISLASGETNHDVDAGINQPAAAQLGDFVWEDLDANGVQDDGNTGIEGVTVELFACDAGTPQSGTVLATQSTDADGGYLFTDLDPGSYAVRFDASTATVGAGEWVFTQQNVGDDTTDSDADTDTGISSPCVDLAAGESNRTVDAGLYRPASIGDFVWRDTDRDGIQDDGEVGEPNVEVQLLVCDATGTPVTPAEATTSTDADGLYQFTGLTPGSYALAFASPSGTVFSPRDVGTDDALDSDANQTTGRTICTTLASGEDDPTWDAGVHEPVDPAITIEKLTNGFDADGANDSDVPQLAPGETVTWTYQVTNMGNVAFNQEQVTVIDDQGVTPSLDAASDDGGDGVLSPGETWLYTASGTALDLAADASEVTIVPGCDPEGTGDTRSTYENTGTVTADGLEDSDPSHYCNPAPGLVLEKLTNGLDADDPNDGPQIAPGASVTWTYEATNTGEVPFDFNDVAVTDSVLGDISTVDGFEFVAASDDGNDGILSPGETWIYRVTGEALDLQANSASYILDEGCDPNDTGSLRRTYENVGTVTADGATDEDPSHYCNPPAIDIEKATNGEDADDPTGPVIPVGDAVNWDYVVTNTGSVALSQVTVTDNQGVAVSCPQDSLAVDESMTCTAQGTAQAGQYANVGTVTGQSPDGEMVSDDDPSHYLGADGNIDVEKSVSVDGGETWLDADDAPGPRVFVCTSGSNKYDDDGSKDDDSKSWDSDGSKDDDSKSWDSDGSKDHDDKDDINCIDQVRFQYVVTNTGGAELTDVALNDDVFDVSACTIPTTLAPGEQAECVLGPVPAEVGQHTNVATVTGVASGIPVEDSDAANYFGEECADCQLKDDDGPPQEGPGTPGYWKTHPGMPGRWRRSPSVGRLTARPKPLTC